MNNRLTTLELCKILADKTGRDIDEVTSFVKELLDVLSHSVDKDNSIEIKGLGVFKAQYIEERESVNIHSNERFVIPAHFRYVFLPDKKLRDAVNKPFSFFESVELAEGVSMEDLTLSEEDSEIDDSEELYDDSEPLESVPVEAKLEEGLETQEEVIAEESQEEVLVIESAEDEDISEEILDDTVIEPIVAEVLFEGESVELDVSLDETSDIEELVKEDTKEEPTETIDEEIEIKPLEEELNEPLDEAEEEYFKTTEGLSGNKKMLLFVLLAAIVTLGGIYLYKNYASKDESIEDKQAKVVPVDSVDQTSGMDVVMEPTDSIFSSDSTIALMSDIEAPENKVDPVVEKSVSSEEIIPKEPEKKVEKELPKVIDHVTVQSGDLMTVFALKYYGKKVFWVYIYEHNKKVIKNPHNVPIGTKLEIPAPHLYGIDAKDKKSVEKAVQKQSELASETFK